MFRLAPLGWAEERGQPYVRFAGADLDEQAAAIYVDRFRIIAVGKRLVHVPYLMS